MSHVKQSLIELIETLSENQILYVYTLVKKLFGSN